MQISDSEKHIMDILWKMSPLSAKSIIENLNSDLRWQDKTVKTLVNRLLKKEVISFKKKGREYLYFPLVSEESYIESESKSFLSKVFNGKVSSLVAAFAKHDGLTKKDRLELKALLSELENESGGAKK